MDRHRPERTGTAPSANLAALFDTIAGAGKANHASTSQP